MTEVLVKNKIINIALKFIDDRFSVIPVNPKTKKTPLKSWKVYQKRCATEEEIEKWEVEYPDMGLALVCGEISQNIYAIDLDNELAKKWLAENAPTTGVYQSTQNGGKHALFKIPEGQIITNKTRLLGNTENVPHVDIRGTGGYIIIDPTAGYKFEYPEGLNGWDDIPTWDYRQVININQQNQKNTFTENSNVNIGLSHVSESASDLRIVNEGRRNSELTKKSGRWFGLNLTFKEVMMLAEKCNENYFKPPLDQKEVSRITHSIHKTHQENNPSNKIVFEGVKHKKKFPEHLLNPGGLLQEIMDYIKRASAVSHPVFDLPAAITLLGAVAAQRIMTETGLRTNFYCIALGYSGSGKNGCHAPMELLLNQKELINLIGPDDLTSDAAILKWISTNGQECTLLRIDEIGNLLKKARNPKHPASQIPNFLTKAFSATDKQMMKSYAGADKIKACFHHVCVYGSSTNRVFWESLNSGGVENGFLPRLLIFDSRHVPELPREEIDIEPPEYLVKQLIKIHNISISFKEPHHNLDVPVPIPFEIHQSDESRKIFKEWELKQHGYKIEYCETNEMLSRIYNRTAEHARKLSLIHCLSKYGADIINNEIEPDSVLWATKLVEFLVDDMKVPLSEELSDNQYQKLKNQIISLIRRKSEPKRKGVTIGKIYNDINSSKRQIDEALFMLIESGKLAKDQHYKPKTGPSTTVYGFVRKT